MKRRFRPLVMAILPVFVFAALSGCFHRRPDEVEMEELWRLKNLLLSSTPEFIRTFMPHPDFTYENIAGLRPGASPRDVEAVFGPPDKTRFAVFGLNSPDPWRSIVFEYSMGHNFEGKYSKNTNVLVFSAEHSPPRLEFWDIQMVYSTRPSPRMHPADREFRP